MKTIYLDVTTLLHFPYLTGIQRAVSEIAVRLIADQKKRDYNFVMLSHIADNRFHICDNESFMAYYLFSQGEKAACIGAEEIAVEQLTPGSFWLDIDSVWTNRLSRNLLYPRLAQKNIQIAVYVHDVIPITHPKLVSEDNLLRFPAYLGAVFDYADVIYAQTEFTLSEIQKTAREAGCKREIRYGITIPGSDFVKRIRKDIKVHAQVQKIVEKGKILLTVSTLEIRKNHKVLLDAFDAGLCEMGYQMVFVGRSGWKVDTLLERIKSHPQNGKSLFHLEGINDETLHYLYENAQFVLFPSYIEGYGLSSVEAMRYEVPAILSDVPVMREIGGEFCDYFEPDSPGQLIKIIRDYEKRPERYAEKKAALKKFVLPTWDNCAAAILDSILSFR